MILQKQVRWEDKGSVSGLCLVAIFTAKTQDFIGTGRNCGGTSDRRNHVGKRFLAISAQKGHFATPSIDKSLAI